MKFPYSLLYYIVSEDYDWQEMTDLPFEVDDKDDYDEVCDKFDKYWCEHAMEIVEDSQTYYDLEKGYERRRVIFMFDGKYYGFTYTWSPYTGYEDFPDEDLQEYEPHQETVTIYRLKKNETKREDY